MKRIIIAASSLALALGILTAPQALADYGTCAADQNGSEVAGATISYGGTTYSSPSMNKPWLVACNDSGKSYYVVMIGIYTGAGSALTADLTGQYQDLDYTVSLPTSGTSVTIADGIGSISAFTPGSTTTFTVRPVLASVVNSNDRPLECRTNGISDSNGFKPACAESVSGLASATQRIARVQVRYGQSFSKLTGMYVSASADLWQVELVGRCPTQTYGGSESGDGGAYKPSQLRATVETSLKVQLLGPHKNASGGPNEGSLTAVIPFTTVQGCFGATPSEMQSATSMTRTENGITENGTTSGTGGLAYSVTGSSSGLVVSVPTVTFSQPTYNLKFTKTTASGTTDSASGGNPENTSTSTGLIAGVKAKGTKGKASASFKKVSTVKSYAVEAQLSSGKGSTKKGKCSTKGTKVTCTVAKLKKGAWTLRITSTLTAGGAGPTATKPGIKVK